MVKRTMKKRVVHRLELREKRGFLGLLNAILFEKKVKEVYNYRYDFNLYNEAFFFFNVDMLRKVVVVGKFGTYART